MRTYTNKDGSVSIILENDERVNIINPLLDEIALICSRENTLHFNFLEYGDIKKVKRSQKNLKILAKNLNEIRKNVDKI